jgi:LysM repeat protein
MLPLLFVLLVGSPGDCSYTVGKGDTLSRIAVRHGVTEKDLIAANPALGKNPDMLSLGQVLDVCPDEPEEPKPAKSSGATKKCGTGGHVVEHEVAGGDTLSKIAASYGVTESAIKGRNPAIAKDPDALRVGQTVEVCVADGLAKKSKACNFETPLFRHVVVPGEHLGQVAGRYGVRKADLLKLNARLSKDPNKLTVGQTIAVCPEISPRERTRITYTVQDGDTFGEIAERYGLTRRELERYQQGKLTDASSLRDGQKLVVWVDGGIVEGFARETDKGSLKGGVQLPPGRHYHVKWEAAAWGTAGTIRDIHLPAQDAGRAQDSRRRHQPAQRRQVRAAHLASARSRCRRGLCAQGRSRRGDALPLGECEQPRRRAHVDVGESFRRHQQCHVHLHGLSDPEALVRIRGE